MSFSEIILSQLGSPARAFDWIDALLIITAIAVVVMLELLVRKAMKALFRRVWLRVAEEYRKANKL